MPSLLTERLYLAHPHEVAGLHRQNVGYSPPRELGRIDLLARVKRAVERRFSPERSRMLAAESVAGAIAQRWRDSGILRWQRDEAGLPIPLEAGESHDWRFAYRLSPSGKNLFACWSCNPRPIPTSGSTGPCPGQAVGFGLEHILALAVFGGADYRPDARGIPLPTNRAVMACSCCKLVGPWTDRDPVARQTVCPLCAEETKALLSGREVKAAIYGRAPY